MINEDQCRQFKEQMNTKLMTPALMLMFGILLMILGIVYWLYFLIDVVLYITTALIALFIGIPFFFWPFFSLFLFSPCDPLEPFDPPLELREDFLGDAFGVLPGPDLDFALAPAAAGVEEWLNLHLSPKRQVPAL